MIGSKTAPSPINVQSRTALGRLIYVLAASGFACWLVGAAVMGMGHASWGLALRVLSLPLVAVPVLRRPTLLKWTFLCMLAGVELGLDFPRIAAQSLLPGDLFLRLVRMVVAPLILASIPAGIAAHGYLRSVGRVALKALVLFEVITTLGLIIGWVAEAVSGAGSGIALPASAASEPMAARQLSPDWQQIILNLFPDNIAQSVSENRILQVVVLAVLFGIALALLPENKRAPLINLLQALTDTIFQLVRIIMYLAPLAAGSAMAYTVGRMGFSALLPLVKLVITCYLALIAFCLLVLLPALLLFRVPLRRFAESVGEPVAIGFATSTSEAALPLAMERMEELGVPGWIVSFVIPLGYSFNMCGSSVYLSLAAVFAAQAGGLHLTLGQGAEMLAVLVLASKGMAGVPRAVFVILLATAGTVHIPTTPILMILGVDTIMDMGRTAVNVLGNCLASAAIARTEDQHVFSRVSNVNC